jgi:hypothetical protein
MASKRRIRRRSCESKRRFQTEQEAHRVIAMLHYRGRVRGFLGTYKCQFCGGFHYGHTRL